MSAPFKEQIADLTSDISHDVVNLLLRDICEAAHSTGANGDPLVATSEVEELLDRIAKMRRTRRRRSKTNTNISKGPSICRLANFSSSQKGQANYVARPASILSPQAKRCKQIER